MAEHHDNAFPVPSQPRPLIAIQSRGIGPKTILAVSARELHEKLGVKKDFTDWLFQYTNKDDWRKDKDFNVFPLEGENPKGGRPAIDAALSVQMAEHIAMLTRTKKGYEVREYFRQARDERDSGLAPATRGDLLVQMAEAYRAQEQRLIAIETAQQSQALELIEQQASVIAHLQLIVQANAKADLALEGAHLMTVEEFVLKNGLIHQFPPSSHKRLSDWLKDFCQRYGLDVPKSPVYGKHWDEENAYPLQAFGALLRAETKRPKQITLVQPAE